MSYSLLFLSLFINLLVGSVVFLSNTKAKINKTFYLFTLGCCFWVAGLSLLSITQNFMFDKLIILGSVLAVASLYIFSLNFPVSNTKLFIKDELKKILPFLVISILIPTNYIIKSVSFLERRVIPENGPLFPLYALILIIYLALSLRNLLHSFRKSNPVQRNKMSYFLVGIAVLVISSLVGNLILPLFNIFTLNHLGPLSLSIFTTLAGYSIFAKRLLDIRFILQKTIIYSIIFLLISFLYIYLIKILTLFLSISHSSLLSSIFVIFLGLISLPSIDSWLRNVTDKWLFNKKIKYSDSLLKLSKSLTVLNNIDDFPDHITESLKEIFKLKTSLLNIAQPNISALGTEPSFSDNNTILYIPIISRKKLIATLFLGKKKSGASYTNRDTHFLTTFSYHLASKLKQLHLIGELRYYSRNLENNLEKTEVKLTEVNSAQEKMIIDISHNLQTPLTVLRGEIDSLVKGNSSFELKGVKKLDRSVEKISQFITRLLQSANNAKNRYEYESVNLAELVLGTLEYITIVAEAQAIEVNSDIEDNIYINADRKYIEEVLVNILSNAIKYRRKAVIHKISVTLRTNEKYAICSVTDNGLGISEKDQEHIFERWYQVDTLQKGSGLGLAISNNIVQDHGGHISVQSSQEKGSTFNIFIPHLRKKAA